MLLSLWGWNALHLKKKHFSDTRMLVGAGGYPTPDRTKDIQSIQIFWLHLSSIPGNHVIFVFSPWPFSSVPLLVIVRSNVLAFLAHILFLRSFVFYVLLEHYTDTFVGSILNSYLRHHSNDIILQTVIEVGKYLGYDTLHLLSYFIFVCCLIYSSRMQTLVGLCYIYLCVPYRNQKTLCAFSIEWKSK